MIDEKEFQRIINWSPDWPKQHKPQQEILKAWEAVKSGKNPYRIVAIAAGTRFGKSMLCAYIATREFINNINDLLEKKDVKPIHIWIVAPTYGLTEKVFEWVVKFFSAAYPSFSKYVSHSPNRPGYIKLPMGCKIECKSGETEDSMLGEELDLAVVDETPRIKRLVWGTLYERMGSRRGKVILIGTPRGKNWYHEEWVQANKHNTGFHYKTIDSPYYPRDMYEEAKKKLPERIFRQDHEAEFLDDAAGVFREVKEIVEDCDRDVDSSHHYILGVDLGKIESFTVLTIIDAITKKVVYWDRFNKIEYPFQKKRIIAQARRYNNARIIVDSTGVGQGIKDDLEREGLFIDDFSFSGKSKKELIEKLSVFIEQKYIRIPNQQILIDELQAYGYQIINPKTGEPFKDIRYGPPTGVHDDAVDSLALAVWGLNPGEALVKNKLKEVLKKRSIRKPKSFI